MSRRTIAQLLAEVQSNFPDNTTHAITPAVLRAFLNDFLATMRPAFGGLHITIPYSLVAHGFPSVLSMQSVSVAVAPEWVANAFAGTLSRPAGDDGGISYFVVSADLEAPNADNVTLEIYKNGVATGISSRINAEGNNRPFSITLAGLDDSGGVPVDYDLRISLDGGSSTVVVNQLSFVGQAVPTWN